MKCYYYILLNKGHCPTGDDPETTTDETDCEGVYASGDRGVGESGNLCHVDCSNRGVCDFHTGLCKCFTGYTGVNCNKRIKLSKK